VFQAGYGSAFIQDADRTIRAE